MPKRPGKGGPKKAPAKGKQKRKHSPTMEELFPNEFRVVREYERRGLAPPRKKPKAKPKAASSSSAAARVPSPAAPAGRPVPARLESKYDSDATVSEPEPDVADMDVDAPPPPPVSAAPAAPPLQPVISVQPAGVPDADRAPTTFTEMVRADEDLRNDLPLDYVWLKTHLTKDQRRDWYGEHPDYLYESDFIDTDDEADRSDLTSQHGSDWSWSPTPPSSVAPAASMSVSSSSPAASEAPSAAPAALPAFTRKRPHSLMDSLAGVPNPDAGRPAPLARREPTPSQPDAVALSRQERDRERERAIAEASAPQPELAPVHRSRRRKYSRLMPATPDTETSADTELLEARNPIPVEGPLRPPPRHPLADNPRAPGIFREHHPPPAREHTPPVGSLFSAFVRRPQAAASSAAPAAPPRDVIDLTMDDEPMPTGLQLGHLPLAISDFLPADEAEDHVRTVQDLINRYAGSYGDEPYDLAELTRQLRDPAVRALGRNAPYAQARAYNVYRTRQLKLLEDSMRK